MHPETTFRFVGWTLVGAGSVVCGVAAVTALFAWAAPWPGLFAAFVVLLIGLSSVGLGIRYVTVPVTESGEAEWLGRPRRRRR